MKSIKLWFAIINTLFLAFFLQNVTATTISPTSGSATNIIGGTIDGVIDGTPDFQSSNQQLIVGTSGNGSFETLYPNGITIRFNLGGIYDLTDFLLWNNAGNATVATPRNGDGEGVENFSLEFFNFSQSSLGTPLNFLATDPAGTNGYEAFSLGLVENVQYVDFTIKSSGPVYIAPLNIEKQYAAFYEVKFNGTYSDSSTVPEPATMVLFGIGLLGLAGVSRKKNSKRLNKF